jgi:hypothetical protein
VISSLLTISEIHARLSGDSVVLRIARQVYGRCWWLPEDRAVREAFRNRLGFSE